MIRKSSKQKPNKHKKTEIRYKQGRNQIDDETTQGIFKKEIEIAIKYIKEGKSPD